MHTAGQFSNLRDIMITPLPKIYDWGQTTDEPAIAREDLSVARHLQTIGKVIDYDRLAASVQGMSDQLNEQVYSPLNEWLKVFRKIQVR